MRVRVVRPRREAAVGRVRERLGPPRDKAAREAHRRARKARLERGRAGACAVVARGRGDRGRAQRVGELLRGKGHVLRGGGAAVERGRKVRGAVRERDALARVHVRGLGHGEARRERGARGVRREVGQHDVRVPAARGLVGEQQLLDVVRRPHGRDAERRARDGRKDVRHVERAHARGEAVARDRQRPRVRDAVDHAAPHRRVERGRLARRAHKVRRVHHRLQQLDVKEAQRRCRLKAGVEHRVALRVDHERVRVVPRLLRHLCQRLLRKRQWKINSYHSKKCLCCFLFV